MALLTLLRLPCIAPRGSVAAPSPWLGQSREPSGELSRGPEGARAALAACWGVAGSCGRERELGVALPAGSRPKLLGVSRGRFAGGGVCAGQSLSVLAAGVLCRS